jgi:hypothetical protein
MLVRKGSKCAMNGRLNMQAVPRISVPLTVIRMLAVQKKADISNVAFSGLSAAMYGYAIPEASKPVFQ